ncbi:MAG: hypothetical protein AB1491_09565 [Thermodesulfobacteriota bacterium]
MVGPPTLALPGLVLAYGAGTLAAQVLILREVLVLCQGQELKLALGLWSWLVWTGLGSLWGGRLAARWSPDPKSVGVLLYFLGWLLPATVFLARLLPTLAALPEGQSLSVGAALVLFLAVLAPFCLISGGFFPWACQALGAGASREALGRTYSLEALGAALGISLLQLLLLGHWSTLALSLGAGFLLALIAWALAVPASLPARLGYLLGLGVLGAALIFSGHLENLSRRGQWPGRRVVAAADSPYALLTATREAEQLSFFANKLWYFTYPDPYSAEQAVQWGLLEHPRPKRVLLLGGGVAGLIQEILKTKSVTRLDYVELDPELVRLAQRLLPQAAGGVARDPRVHLIFQDARRFLTHTPSRYDVIILSLPEPHNAQLNRYYTLEFFQIVSRHLLPGGVFTFSLGGGATSLNPLRAAYLALSYRTLGRVFPEVLVFPGERVRFFASPTPGALVADPEELAARLASRALPLLYVRDYYLLTDLSLPRQHYLRQLLDRQPGEINTDLNPKSYFYDLVLTGSLERLPLKDILLTLKGLPVYLPWAVLGLGALLLAAFFRRRPQPRYLCQVVVMGLGTMALEILVLILFQVHLGYLYRQLGLLIAAFMAGLGGGGAWGLRLVRRSQARVRWLMGLQGGLAALALFLALALPGLADSPWLSREWLIQAASILILSLAGFAGGGIFALSASLWVAGREGAPGGFGLFYALDLLGATGGLLGLSLLVLPVWGIVPALYLVAALHAWAALLLALFGLRRA